MTLTEHYQFNMPDGNDTVRVFELNANTSKLDELVHGLEQGKADLDNTGKVTASQLPPMNYDPVGSADEAYTSAVATAATDATAKMNSAVGTASADATAKANGAESRAKAASRPSTWTPSWGEVRSKPSTFTPSAHNQHWNTITGKPGTFPASGHSHSWSTITSKPTTFAPSAHNHDTLYVKAGTGTWIQFIADSGYSRPVRLLSPSHFCKDKFNVVTFYLTIERLSILNVTHLPVGFRPAASIFFPLFSVALDDAYNFGIQIGTNGVVASKGLGLPSSADYTVSGSFLATQ